MRYIMITFINGIVNKQYDVMVNNIYGFIQKSLHVSLGEIVRIKNVNIGAYLIHNGTLKL